MSSNSLRPWGLPPTPLLPRAIRTIFGEQPAPETLRRLTDKPLTIRELGVDFWRHTDAIDTDILQSLVDYVQSVIAQVRQIRLSLLAGGDRLAIEALPLSTRTRNALRHTFSDQRLPEQSTVDDLLNIPNFGIRCLIEFTCVVESAQSFEGTNEALAPLADRPKRTLPSDVGSFFQVLGAWAAGEQQLFDLAQALPEPRPDWPPELRQLWARIGRADARSLAGDIVHRYSVPTLVSRWIYALDDRLADILERRVLATGKPETLEQLGARHDVTRERIRQIEKQTLMQLEDFQSAAYRPVLRRARRLRDKLGSTLPEDDVSLVDALSWIVSDFGPSFPRKLTQQLFLWLAGPYKHQNGWLTADLQIVDKSKAALLSKETDRALIPALDAQVALNDLGIRDTHHSAWIDRLKAFQRVDEGLLHFTGSILDKAEQLLRYVERPITADELVEVIGSSSVRSVRNRLMDDSRFWRINKQNQFVLAGTEGYDEYTGITDEIMQELEACGGSATVEHIVEKITKTYGVQPSSVMAYLSTPLFVRTESGRVRVRVDEELVIITDIAKTAGCYRVDGRWAWRAKVDRQLLRGSGRLIPNAFARELGCDLAAKIEVDSPFGGITVSWPPGSTTGAALGSIRRALEGLGAADGDHVFVIAHEGQIDFQLLRREQLKGTDSAEAKLAHLVGVLEFDESQHLLSQIAAALAIEHHRSGVLAQQIRDTLITRGEDDLAGLIAPPKLSMDQYLDRIGSVLGDGNY